MDKLVLVFIFICSLVGSSIHPIEALSHAAEKIFVTASAPPAGNDGISDAHCPFSSSHSSSGSHHERCGYNHGFVSTFYDSAASWLLNVSISDLKISIYANPDLRGLFKPPIALPLA